MPPLWKMTQSYKYETTSKIVKDEENWIAKNKIPNIFDIFHDWESWNAIMIISENFVVTNR